MKNKNKGTIYDLLKCSSAESYLFLLIFKSYKNLLFIKHFSYKHKRRYADILKQL